MNIARTTIHSKIYFFLPKKIYHQINYSQTEALDLNNPILSKLEQQNLTLDQFLQIKTQIITTGLFHNTFAASRLLKFLATVSIPPNINLTNLLFSKIKHPDVFCYNLAIKAYAKLNSKDSIDSFSLYKNLLMQCLKPNEYTLCFLLDSCSSHGNALSEGKQVHGQIYKHGLCSATFCSTSLIHMYGECGDVADAIQVFDELQSRNEVTWGAIINACFKNSRSFHAITLFKEMMRTCIDPSSAAMVGVLSTVQDLASGRAVHAYIVSKGLEMTITLGTSLVNMYSKFGDAVNAVQVFSAMDSRSTVSLNCLIHGLAMNGDGAAAVRLFKKLVQEQAIVPPNDVTFLSLLHACSHAGLVEDGVQFFTQMGSSYGITPNLKHYGCIVDLYGRAGLIKEAIGVFRAMTMQPDAVIWGALYGACKVHGYERAAELTAAQMIKTLPQSFGYMILSDSYAVLRRWDDVAGVRKTMAQMSIRKMPGSSSMSS